MDAVSLTSALREWERVLGPEHVRSEPESLRRAGTATFRTTGAALAILSPGSRAEVQECVRIANRFRVALYPYSTGKNWGYGSRAPVRDGVLLDLSRLNRIVAFDESLGYVTIEPGVTQRQLQEFLRHRQSGLWMDATGASPDCSIIGNTMERGFGHTPMGDHCGNSCALEIVLPTGECLDTGFSRFPNSPAGPLSRWGVGPSLDGLFTQSNFGIVTRMTVWLMPQPKSFQAFFFLCRDPEALSGVIDALRPLRMNGTLQSVSHIGNDYKVLSATTRYPWEMTGGRTPLSPTEMARLRVERSIGAWTGSGALYGSRAQVKAARAELRRALSGKVDRLQFVDDRLLGVLERFARPLRLVCGWDLSRTVSLLRPVYGLLKGIPTDATLDSCYWRKKGDLPAQTDMDPDRDGCGLLWCSPVVPNTGEHATAVTRLASDVLLAHGFEPQISLSIATARTIMCVTTISYDRDIPGEDERALRCYEDLTAQLLARGYPPYRLNVSSMQQVGSDGAYDDVLRTLKAALDPRDVLAPGRYAPAPTVREPAMAGVLKSRS